MNWRRGLVRSWVVLSAIWIGYTVWRLYSGCFELIALDEAPTGKTFCYVDGWHLVAGARQVEQLGKFTTFHWLNWSSLAILPPIGLLVFGVLAIWIIAGFQDSV